MEKVKLKRFFALVFYWASGMGDSLAVEHANTATNSEVADMIDFIYKIDG